MNIRPDMFSGRPVAFSDGFYDNRILAKCVQGACIAAFVPWALIFVHASAAGSFAGGLTELETFDTVPWAVTRLATLLAAIVLFLTWKYRASANLVMLTGRQSITPAGAVYWYFVPVAWFWKPLEAMRNLWSGFGVGGSQYDLYLWWIISWGSFGFGMLAGVIAPDMTTAPGTRAYVVFNLVAVALIAAAFVSAADVVWRVSKAESRILFVRAPR